MPLLSTKIPSRILLSGKECKLGDEEVLKIIYPGDTATEVGECFLLPKKNIQDVLNTAQEGFERFRHTTPTRRAAILNRLAELLEIHFEDISKLITLETAKPVKLSDAEVNRAIGIFRSYAAELAHLESKSFFIEDREAQVRYFPLGPVLAITPWNFPLNLVAHKLAPAIAAGNSITIKPASRTPLTALYLGKLAVESGYNAISVIPCKGSMAEALLLPDVFKKLSFTGSSEVGWHLKALAVKKNVTLELGGSAACLIEDYHKDDLQYIATRCAQGAFWFAGQVCISVQRLYVNHKIHDEFMEAFISATRALRVGDPLLADTDVGPMISLDDVYRTRDIIKQAIHDGANVVYGGNTFNSFTMNPTILNRTQPEMNVNAEECFAPIVTITPYQKFEDGLRLANQSRYGLQAGVFTRDRGKAKQAYDTLEVGGVIVNDVPTLRLDYLPYGGVKDSGMGREGVLTGLAEMSYLKTMILKDLSVTERP